MAHRSEPSDPYYSAELTTMLNRALFIAKVIFFFENKILIDYICKKLMEEIMEDIIDIAIKLLAEVAAEKRGVELKEEYQITLE